MTWLLPSLGLYFLCLFPLLILFQPNWKTWPSLCFSDMNMPMVLRAFQPGRLFPEISVSLSLWFLSLLFRKPSLPTLSKTIHQTHAPLMLLYLSAKPYHDLWNSFWNIWKSSLITTRRGWLLTDDRLKSKFLNMDSLQHGLSRAFLALSLASYFLCHPVRCFLLPPITLPHLNHTCSSCAHLPV